MDIDIVIPWIDWSSIPLRENMIRHGGHPEGIITNSNDKYEELKYLLRSIVKNKIKYRKIFIVHSDLNKPPSYLKKNHNSLYFIKHSEIVKNKNYLPLIHRETININFINIPGISRFFLYFEDDFIVMSNKLVENEIKRYKNKEIFTYKSNLYKLKEQNIEKAYKLWFLTAINSEKIVINKSTLNTPFCEHFIRFYDCEIIKEMENKYKKQFEITRNYHKYDLNCENVICLNCMYVQYLIQNYNFKIYTPNRELKIISCSQNKSIEENKKYLMGALNESKNYEMICIQGHGISDERLKLNELYKIYKLWLDFHFPFKTIFEKSSTVRSFGISIFK